MTVCPFYFFFFSSRRRHTRCGRDWSSDVCSSDLAREADAMEASRVLMERDPLSGLTSGVIGRASCKGKSVDLGGRRIIKKKKKKKKNKDTSSIKESGEQQKKIWKKK